MNGSPRPTDAAHDLNWPLESDWTAALARQLADPDFVALQRRLAHERRSTTIYPAPGDVFAAFGSTPLSRTRVVILGQDPYHGPGQAMGLSFSVPTGVKIPPSLRNIFTELAADQDVPRPTSGDLTPWAQQGVLLLNTVLTVQQGAAHSHRGIGWESFTDGVMQRLNEQPQPVVFVLWGKPAQQKQKWLDARHPVIAAPHPSPLSAHRGFFGSRPFSAINEHLTQAGRGVIDWQLP